MQMSEIDKNDCGQIIIEVAYMTKLIGRYQSCGIRNLEY